MLMMERKWKDWMNRINSTYNQNNFGDNKYIQIIRKDGSGNGELCQKQILIKV